MIENTKDNQEKMFFLTRTEGVEITSIEEVFNCGNQALYDPQRPDLEFDRFGRNYTDRQFVELCLTIYILFLGEEYRFKSLSCKWYARTGAWVATLKLIDEELVFELGALIGFIAERMKRQKMKGGQNNG